MLQEIDSICQRTDVQLMPDLFLSGHSHNYQQYTREVSLGGRQLQIPYIVAGTGGINDGTVPQATGQKIGDHTFVKSRQGFGYLLVEVSKARITVQMFAVDPQTKAKTLFQTVNVDLTNNRVS
jgi:hypothetical protein